nr:50S ribosomal protein L37ae [Candidatus Sigynarchaeum springense]MDO8118901.1 50S ribosomal protein L37ae [Candidatus Sigynarchaeota archaeon]
MARRTKKVGITGRFGARYGTLVRYRTKKILSYKTDIQKCPKCQNRTISRKSVGLWKCRKCGATFTGGAYTLTTTQGLLCARVTKRKERETSA